MNTTVRAKFACASVQNFVESANVSLEAVRPTTYRQPGDTSPLMENEEFYRNTPAGNIVLQGIKLEVAAHFKPGLEYYIDFTLAPSNLTGSANTQG